jgi:FtsP/CotA-like multicopper oxidase with cupredoxin domain
VSGVSKFTAHHHGSGDNKPSNILINGRGKYFGNLTEVEKVQESTIKPFENEVTKSSQIVAETTQKLADATFDLETEESSNDVTTTEDLENTENSSTENSLIKNFENERNFHEFPDKIRTKRALHPPNEHSQFVPYETFNVVKGHRYRFRHINAGFLNCPIQLSIDNHTILAIATDGSDIEPKEVTFLVTYAGERWDFVVNANQAVGNYFIRARGLMDCDERFTSSFQLAVLHYQGAPEEEPNYVKPSYHLDRTGLTLNSLNKAHGEKDSMTVAETVAKNAKNLIGKLEPDFKFYLSYDFYGIDNPLFHASNLYGFNQGEKKF